MNGAVMLLLGIAVLVCGYLFYGRWLAREWGVDPSRETPAYTYEDDVDYMPAKPAVLMGHHFSFFIRNTANVRTSKTLTSARRT